MQNILMLILILIIYLQASNEDDDKAEIFASMANATEVISLSSEETCKPQEKKFIRDEEKLWWSHWYLNLNDKLELVGKHLSLSFKKWSYLLQSSQQIWFSFLLNHTSNLQ